MGIPAVVGTENATSVLEDGQEVTVDGFNGKVFAGRAKSKKIEILPIVEGTRTKIKVLLDLPEYAERASKTECKDVGLLRIEGIIAENGKHPDYFLNKKKVEEYENIIYNGISKIAQYFDERHKSRCRHLPKSRRADFGRVCSYG